MKTSKRKNKMILIAMAMTMAVFTGCENEEMTTDVINNGEEIEGTFTIEVPSLDQTRGIFDELNGESDITKVRLLVFKRTSTGGSAPSAGTPLVKNLLFEVSDTEKPNQTIVKLNETTYQGTLKILPYGTYHSYLIANENSDLQLDTLIAGVHTYGDLEKIKLTTRPSHSGGKTDNIIFTAQSTQGMSSENFTNSFSLQRSVARVSNIYIKKDTKFDRVEGQGIVKILSVKILNRNKQSFLIPSSFNYYSDEIIDPLPALPLTIPNHTNISSDADLALEIPCIEYLWEFYSTSGIPTIEITWQVDGGEPITKTVNFEGKEGYSSTYSGVKRNNIYSCVLTIKDNDVTGKMRATVLSWSNNTFEKDITSGY